MLIQPSGWVLMNISNEVFSFATTLSLKSRRSLSSPVLEDCRVAELNDEDEETWLK